MCTRGSRFAECSSEKCNVGPNLYGKKVRYAQGLTTTNRDCRVRLFGPGTPWGLFWGLLRAVGAGTCPRAGAHGGLSRGVPARKWGAGPGMIAQTCCWGGYSPRVGGRQLELGHFGGVPQGCRVGFLRLPGRFLKGCRVGWQAMRLLGRSLDSPEVAG